MFGSLNGECQGGQIVASNVLAMQEVKANTILRELGLRQDILEFVYAAIDEVNAQSANGTAIVKTPETRLLGSANGVDSLTFVNLVVAIEEQIQDKLGQSVVLVDEDSMALQEHPFRTIGTLAEYVEKLVNKQKPN
jgi:D-alanine--poly(phosphoribitol) ligase subunit 2